MSLWVSTIGRNNPAAKSTKAVKRPALRKRSAPVALSAKEILERSKLVPNDKDLQHREVRHP